MHPGPQGQQTVVRWTAPSSGTFNISGRFEGIAGGHATTDVHVMHNSTSIFDGYVNGLGSVVPYSMQRTVTAGDTIDFVVGDGGNAYWSDSTGLGATITGQSVAQGGSGTGIQWLVTDQLGTPRMVFDQTGSFASVKRHDYLPFGEELFVGAGGRTEGQGYAQVYSVSDGNRQKFTQKERDNETGLDYFGARYYSSMQGRFTSPDEFKGGPEELFGRVDPHDPLFYADTAEPQSLNKYHYCLNNPLRYIDPDGHQTTVADRLRNAASRVRDAAATLVRAAEPIINGASSAMAEDNGLSENPGPQSSVGRSIGHGFAALQSVTEIVTGFATAVAGGGEAGLTAPACASGVGCAAPAVGVGGSRGWGRSIDSWGRSRG